MRPFIIFASNLPVNFGGENRAVGMSGMMFSNTAFGVIPRGEPLIRMTVEPETGRYVHVREQRITEWQVEWLARPRRNEHTIPDFFAPNAPPNKLDILRGRK